MHDRHILLCIQPQWLSHFLARTLRKRGYVVIAARRGDEALNWLTSLHNCGRPPKLIVLSEDTQEAEVSILALNLPVRGEENTFMVLSRNRPDWTFDLEGAGRVWFTPLSLSVEDMATEMEKVLNQKGADS